MSPLHIQPETRAPGRKALVLIQDGSGTPPLYCVHAQAGHVRLFHNLARHLDHGRPVYGLQAVPCDHAAAPPRRFEEMAERYASEIRELQPRGPYLILGECSGGQLALELARQLRANGEAGSLLALVDSFGPGEPTLRRFVPAPAYRSADSIRMLRFHLSTVRRIERSTRRAYVSERLTRLLGRLRTKATGRRGAPSGELVNQQAFSEALDAYEPEPYPGRVVLFRGARLPSGVRSRRDLGWEAVAASLEIIELPAYFGTTMLEPAVGLLAEKLAHALEGARSVAARA